MTDLDPDDAIRLLLSDLTAERDRFIADLFQDAENSVAVDDQRDRIGDQIQAAQQETARIHALAASPRAQQSAEVRRDLQAALEALAVQTEKLMEAVVAVGNQEDAELQSAMTLRARFMRLGLSQHHQELSVAQEADFDRRKADMQDLVVAAVRAAGGEQGASTPAKPGEAISTVIEAYRASQVVEGAWTAKTAIEIMAGLGLWVRIVGDQPITRYDHEQHRRYKATLQRLPANLNKLPRY